MSIAVLGMHTCDCTHMCICIVRSPKVGRVAWCSLRLASFVPTLLTPVNACQMERNTLPSCVVTLAGLGRMLLVMQTLRIQTCTDVRKITRIKRKTARDTNMNRTDMYIRYTYVCVSTYIQTATSTNFHNRDMHAYVCLYTYVPMYQVLSKSAVGCQAA